MNPNEIDPMHMFECAVLAENLKKSSELWSKKYFISGFLRTDDRYVGCVTTSLTTAHGKASILYFLCFETN